MSLHKICKRIDFQSKEWEDYCKWRNMLFAGFKSLDSSIQNSIFEPALEDDWNFAVTAGQHLTDVVNDFDFAKSYSERLNVDVILSFDFIDNANRECEIIGYDILDGALNYSLLTNFGNDINIVNMYLDSNGLISSRSNAITVHEWFLSKMPDDPHVLGSKTCAVYPQIETYTNA